MPGGQIRMGIFKRRAASAMSGVESFAKARNSDSAFMLRACSGSVGFAKEGTGNQNGLFRFAPDDVLVVTTVDQGVDFASGSVTKQNSALHAFAEEDL